MDGLSRLISLHTGVDDPAADGLARLARCERHWRHRLYWAARLAGSGRWSGIDLGADPVVRLWQRALAAEEASTGDRRRLLRDWRACPQPLVTRKGGSA